ncbi:MAG: hypothetical protein KAT05_09765 [Spirochaetes bacterium]|nr:hypothetical protein [Spirochaetota bacterium]
MTEQRKVMYFGRPINTYAQNAHDDGKLSEELMGVIRVAFPDFIIKDPNQPKHDDGYKKKGMSYFYEDVVPLCDSGTFLAFRDGWWGAGVFGEAKAICGRGQTIYKVYEKNGLWIIDPMVISLEQNRVLTIEETRVRVRDKNRDFLPY